MILRRHNSRDATIRFISTGTKKKVRYQAAISGNVKDDYLPSVHGVGFMGAGQHKASINYKRTKKYAVWQKMIERCYCPKTQERQPTYKGCTVCLEWHNFQVFAEWFDSNYIEGYQLDKDISVSGNKEYSPLNCTFVSQAENVIAATAKTYTMKSPSGDVVVIYNMREFCKSNSLTMSSMSRVFSGERSHHKGWTIQ